MGKLMKILLVLLLVLGAAGAGAFFFLGKDAEGSEDKEKEKEPSAEELAALSIDPDVITTNLPSLNCGHLQCKILLDN